MRRVVILMALLGAAFLSARTADADPFTVVLADAHVGSGGTIWFSSLPESDLAFGSTLIVVGSHKSEVSDAILTLTGSGPVGGVFSSASNSWRAADASDFLGGLTSGATFTHGHGAGGALSNGASAGGGGKEKGDADPDGSGSSGTGGSGAITSTVTGSTSRSSVSALSGTTAAGTTGVFTASAAPIATNPEPSPLLLAVSGLAVFFLWKRLRPRTAL